jgi:hypothetical protein
MEQLVDFLTQLKGNSLDLGITNIPERVSEVNEGRRLGKSDHVMILTKVAIGEKKKNSTKLDQSGLEQNVHC